jgi:DNA-binding GntR family transcriptional regulator
VSLHSSNGDPSDPADAHAAAPAPTSLSTLAYEAIRARLRTGTVRPGDRLVEADLAGQLGMSRVPVRQALHSLVAEGLLVGTARGYRIPALSRQDMRDVFELRKLLEPRAAALAARDIGADEVAKLREYVADARRACERGETGELFRCSLKFRDGWLKAVRNARLSSTITRYSDQVLQVRQATLFRPDIQKTVIAGFEAIVSALEAHDSVAAHDVMLQFVLAAERDFVMLSEEEDGPAGERAAG